MARECHLLGRAGQRQGDGIGQFGRGDAPAAGQIGLGNLGDLRLAGRAIAAMDQKHRAARAARWRGHDHGYVAAIGRDHEPLAVVCPDLRRTCHETDPSRKIRRLQYALLQRPQDSSEAP